jgi:hypothetical protein
MVKKQAMQETVPQKSETQNGNLNRAEQGETPMGEGPHGAGKTNHETATLRSGNLPKSEAVTCIDRDKNNGTAIRCAKFQNESLMPDGRRILNQPSSGSKHLSTTSGGN